MRYVFYDDFKPGLVKDDAVVDISDELEVKPYQTPQMVVEKFITEYETLKPALEKALEKVRPSAEKVLEGVLSGNKIANENGITTVVDNAATGTLRHVREIEKRNQLSTRMILNIPVEQMNNMTVLGITSGMGSPLVKIGGVKIFTDGSIGAMTAAVSKGYLDNPKNKGMMLLHYL